jgi:hypothetical protein
MRRNSVPWIAYLLLSFTGSGIAWADESQGAYVAQDTGVRAGSVVGHSSFNGDEYLTLGAAFGLGHRFGRLTVEAEYDYLTLQSGGAQSVVLGIAHRVGVNARVDILRVGRRFVGKNSRLVFWGELGVGKQHTSWAEGAVDPTMSRIDRDALNRQIGAMDAAPARPDAAIGFGWLLDHLFEQPRGFPARIGWQFGWRLTGAEQLASIGPVLACENDCMAPEKPADVSLLVTSSLLFSW